MLCPQNVVDLLPEAQNNIPEDTNLCGTAVRPHILYTINHFENFEIVFLFKFVLSKIFAFLCLLMAL